MNRMYTAAMITPSAASPAYQGDPRTLDRNAPSRMVNSPTNPFNPGNPMDESDTISMIVPNTGVIFHSPP